MQQADGINFDPIIHKPEIHPWQLIVAALLFACLIYGAIRWSRSRANKDTGSLHL